MVLLFFACLRDLRGLRANGGASGCRGAIGEAAGSRGAREETRRNAKNSRMMEMGIVPTDGGAANHRLVVQVETRQNDSVPQANQPLTPLQSQNVGTLLFSYVGAWTPEPFGEAREHVAHRETPGTLASQISLRRSFIRHAPMGAAVAFTTDSIQHRGGSLMASVSAPPDDDWRQSVGP